MADIGGISYYENKQAFIAIRSGMYVLKIGFSLQGSCKVIQFKHSLYHSPVRANFGCKMLFGFLRASAQLEHCCKVTASRSY